MALNVAYEMDPKLEVPTTYTAYIGEYSHKYCHRYGRVPTFQDPENPIECNGTIQAR